jgi:hypothetical protein
MSQPVGAQLRHGPAQSRLDHRRNIAFAHVGKSDARKAVLVFPTRYLVKEWAQG